MATSNKNNNNNQNNNNNNQNNNNNNQNNNNNNQNNNENNESKKNNSVNKKSFDLSSIKNQYSSSSNMKDDEFLNCGEAFTDACGLPGPACGHLNVFIGHSDTAKTSALIKSAVDAQQKGKLPVLIITEKKWDFNHAKIMGLDCYQNDNGEWDGNFIYNDDFDYIEQIFDYINKLLDEQEKGNLPVDLVFCWDSVGSIPCQMSFEGKGGNMHTARVISENISQNITKRINKTRKVESPYTNTLIVVNQPYVAPPESPMEQSEIQTKGGKSIYQNATLAFLFGKRNKAGVNELTAVSDKRKLVYARRTRVTILKNHVNGYTYKDGKLIITEHGFIRDTKKEVENYKNQYKKYWSEKLGSENFDMEYKDDNSNDFEDDEIDNNEETEDI